VQNNQIASAQDGRGSPVVDSRVNKLAICSNLMMKRSATELDKYDDVPHLIKLTDIFVTELNRKSHKERKKHSHVKTSYSKQNFRMFKISSQILSEKRAKRSFTVNSR